MVVSKIQYPVSLTVQDNTVYPKKYAHGFWFAVPCCGYTLTDFPISIRLTSLALWQSNDCPSASKATLMNMDKYFMWIHYERFHNHNKAKHNKTGCIFLGIYCIILHSETHRIIKFVAMSVSADARFWSSCPLQSLQSHQVCLVWFLHLICMRRQQLMT